jgi:hypothetical protein
MISSIASPMPVQSNSQRTGQVHASLPELRKLNQAYSRAVYEGAAKVVTGVHQFRNKQHQQMSQGKIYQVWNANMAPIVDRAYNAYETAYLSQPVSLHQRLKGAHRGVELDLRPLPEPTVIPDEVQHRNVLQNMGKYAFNSYFALIGHLTQPFQNRDVVMRVRTNPINKQSTVIITTPQATNLHKPLLKVPVYPLANDSLHRLQAVYLDKLSAGEQKAYAPLLNTES